MGIQELFIDNILMKPGTVKKLQEINTDIEQY